MHTKIKTEKRKVKAKQYHSGKDNEFIYKPLKRKMMAKGEKSCIGPSKEEKGKNPEDNRSAE